jgi:hypothetical protein
MSGAALALDSSTLTTSLVGPPGAQKLWHIATYRHASDLLDVAAGAVAANFAGAMPAACLSTAVKQLRAPPVSGPELCCSDGLPSRQLQLL